MEKINYSHFLHSGYGNSLLREWHSVNVKLSKSMFIYPLFIVDEQVISKIQ